MNKKLFPILNNKLILMWSLFFFSALFFIIGIITSLKIASDKFPFEISWTENGFNNFLNWFDFPIKLYAVSIALLTLAITSMRAFQFDKNLELISSNYKFNNFYKHREEFIKFMNETSFFNLYDSYTTDKRMMILPFYDYYYYNNYSKFKPALPNDSINEIDEFYNNLARIFRNDKALDEIEIKDIKSFPQQRNYIFDPYLEQIFSNQKTRVLTFCQNNNIPIDENEIKRINKYTDIYYRLEFFQALLAFDGEPIPSNFRYPDKYDKFVNNWKFNPS